MISTVKGVNRGVVRSTMECTYGARIEYSAKEGLLIVTLTLRIGVKEAEDNLKA